MALGISFLGHFALVSWLAGRAIAPVPPAAPVWTEASGTVAYQPAPVVPQRQPESTSRPVMKTQKKSTRKPVEPSAPAAQVLLDDVPLASSGAGSLHPKEGFKASKSLDDFSVQTEIRRGETIYPSDPRFSREVLDAQARARVKARVEGAVREEMAIARAQRGLPHLYFSKMNDAVRGALEKLAREEGLQPSALDGALAVGRRYEEAAAQYAKSGEPGLGPPGQAPRLSERLNLPEQQAMKALAQATETLADLTQGKPLKTLTIEVRQTRNDSSPTVVVLQGSGDTAFDAFVLRAWGKADAGHPPDDAFHDDVLRSIWEIEGWQHVKPNALTNLVPGFMGLPPDRLIGLVEGEGYEFRAKLLKAY